MKRILFLIKGLARGGAEQLLINGAPYHDTSRFEYAVAYLLPSKNTLVDELTAAGLRVFCLAGERGVSWLIRLKRLVVREKFDLVHTHSPYPAVGARLALTGRIPRHVSTEHTAWQLLHRATYWGNLLTFPRNDYVFAVSQHVRNSIRYPRPLTLLPMPPLETLYHGIDFSAAESWGSSNEVREEFGISHEVPLIGSVANFEPMKGQQYLLDAMALLRQALPEIRAILVGHGRYENEMRAKARRMGLEERVLFTGYRRDAPRIASAFDVFVLPSANEGLSIALIEAMAQGRASVVTDAGGLPEVVRNGVEGLVVRSRDPSALAEAILVLLRDRPRRRRMEEAARTRARRFDIRRTVQRMEEVYAELLK